MKCFRKTKITFVVKSVCKKSKDDFWKGIERSWRMEQELMMINLAKFHFLLLHIPICQLSKLSMTGHQEFVQVQTLAHKIRQIVVAKSPSFLAYFLVQQWYFQQNLCFGDMLIGWLFLESIDRNLASKYRITHWAWQFSQEKLRTLII